MKKILLCVLLFLFATISGAEFDSLTTDSLASTEGLSSSIVAGHVSAITGELVIHEQDLVLPGPRPFMLQRTYCSGDTSGADLYRSWHFIEPTPIFYYQPDPKGTGTALVTSPHGARAKFEVSLKHKPKGKIAFTFTPTKGYTNCGSKKISGKTNIKNNILSFNNRDKKYRCSGELISGDGTAQLFLQGQREGSWVSFALYEETNSDRTKKHFRYNRDLDIAEIRQGNRADTLVYGKLNFTYPKHGRELVVDSSTGKKVTYHFEKKKRNKNGIIWETLYLNSIENPEKPTVKYSYTKSCRYDHHLIINEKTLPEGRGLKFIYYEKGGDLVDRVKEIQAPIGKNGEYLATHRFSYRFNKSQGKLLFGSTDVIDPYNQKMTYIYDQDERLIHVLRYNSFAQEISRDSFYYESDGNLFAKYVRDPYANILKGQVFDYDDRGNVTRSSSYGNITGKNSPQIILDGNSKPVPNGADCYDHHFSYSDGNDVLTDRESNGKGILYSYYPNSSAVTSKLVVNSETQILLREFNDYDENLFLTKKIVDDGSTSNKEDISGITFRKITHFLPTACAPFGLPQQVTETFLDLKTNEERQLKRTVNSYAIDGKLIQQEVFDAVNVLQYTLYWEYDPHGNVVKEINALKEEIRRSYDKNDNLIFEENGSHGFATHYDYDLMNRLIRVEERHKDGRSFETRHCYDLVGNRISTTGHQGHTTYFSYNDENKLQSITYPAVVSNGTVVQPIESFFYDTLGHQILHKDRLGFTTHTQYNSNGDTLHINYPDGTKEQFEYYLNGALYKTVHKNQSYTLYLRDCQNQIVSEELYSPEGQLLSQSKRAYKGGLLTSEEDGEGMLTIYKYDGAARLIEKTAGKSKTTYIYDSLGNIFQEISWISDQEARIKEYTYDLIGQILSEVTKDLEGRIYLQTEYEYNSFGQKTQTKTGKSLSQSFYSSRQEILKEIDPEGNVTEYLYDYRYPLDGGLVGTKIHTMDPMGNVTIEIKDPLGRTIERQKVNAYGLPLSQKKYLYNLEGDLLRIEEENLIDGVYRSQYVCEWIYNSMHQMIMQTENPDTPHKRTTTHSYNQSGQKASYIKPDGTVLLHAYDAKGRLSALSASDGTISYRYTYNRNDQVTAVEDAVNSQTTYRIFTPEGRLEKEILGNGLHIGYSYDCLDRKTQMILPENVEVHFAYDACHLKSVTCNEMTHTFDAYDESGNLLKSTLPKQAGTISYLYDCNQRRLSLNHAALRHSIQSFDKAGNVLSDQMEDSSGTIPRKFHYDDLYRLTSEEGAESHDFAYDSLHNRIAKDQLPCAIDSLNQLLEQDNIKYTYDCNGNRIQKNEYGKITHYSYDALNRMISVVTPDQSVHYVYDPFDRRLSKGEESYLYDGQNEIGMFRNGKMQELRILSMDGSEHGSAIAIKLDQEFFIPLHDIFGNVSMLLTSDGKPSKVYHYSSFGSELNENRDLNPWRFASKRFDPETGLIYFGRRYYDPQIARWTSPDPAEFIDGLNLYAYLCNNPLNRIDAYGLWGESLWEGGLNFCRGFGAGAYNFGAGAFHSASNMGHWLNADFEYEYYGDSSALNNKMHNTWNEWGELSQRFREAPMESLGCAFAPGCMKAYYLDSNASLADHCSAYGDACFDVAVLVSSVLKGTAALRGGEAVAFDVGRGGVKLIGEVEASVNLAKELNFTHATMKHMSNPNRYVPRHILAEAINSGTKIPDPQMTANTTKIIRNIFKNNKEYELNIIYSEVDKKIFHFHYE